jgi:hypothetical protein
LIASSDASVGPAVDLDDTEPKHPLIDRVRHDIQERLDQLLAEAEKLRHALAALDPRGKPTPKSTPPRTSKSTGQSAPATPPKPARSSRAAGSRARTAPGATKAKVLAALSADGALTAGEVAKATGLPAARSARRLAS